MKTGGVVNDIFLILTTTHGSHLVAYLSPHLLMHASTLNPLLMNMLKLIVSECSSFFQFQKKQFICEIYLNNDDRFVK